MKMRKELVRLAGKVALAGVFLLGICLASGASAQGSDTGYPIDGRIYASIAAPQPGCVIEGTITKMDNDVYYSSKIAIDKIEGINGDVGVWFGTNTPYCTESLAKTIEETLVHFSVLEPSLASPVNTLNIKEGDRIKARVGFRGDEHFAGYFLGGVSILEKASAAPDPYSLHAALASRNYFDDPAHIPGEKGVELLSFRLINYGTEDLIFREVHILGNFNTRDIVNPALYSSKIKLSAPNAVSNSGAVFKGQTVHVAKGSYVDLFVKGDIATTAVSADKSPYSFDQCASTEGTCDPNDLDIVVATKESGERVKVDIDRSAYDITIGSLRGEAFLKLLPNPVVTVTKGTKNVQLISMKITNQGNEDLIFNPFGIALQGTQHDFSDFIKNVAFYIDGVKMTGGTVISDFFPIASFNGKYTLAKGKSVVFTAKGDIAADLPVSSLVFSNYYPGEPANMMAAKGAVSGKTATVTPSEVKTTLNIGIPTQVARLHIDLVKKDIEAVRGEKGVVLQEMRLTNDLNRPALIRVDDFDILSSLAGPSIATVNFDAMYLYLGDQLIGTGTGGNTKMSFGTQVTVPAQGTATLTLRGDVGAGAAGQTLSFKMNYSENVVNGGISTNTPTVLSGTSSAITIGSAAEAPKPSLSLTLLPNPVTTAARGAKGVQLISMKLTNTGNEDLRFADFGIALNGQDSARNLADYVANTAFYLDGKKLPGKVLDDYYMFAWYNADYTLPTGKSIVFTAQGDILKTVGGNELAFSNLYDYGSTTLDFMKATGAVSGKTATANPASVNATLKLSGVGPAATYTLKVNFGSGSGSYEQGKTVAIKANAAPAGKVFDKWAGDTCCVRDAHAAATDLLMPAKALTLTAVYKAAKDCSSEIKEGAMIRVKGDIDVYIVKYRNGKQFKRLILSPSVFKSYGHLKWKDIIEVDRETADAFATSTYVFVRGDSRVWKLEPQGDKGRKTQAAGGYDPDSVYEINATDRNSYL
jgi:hypothetical protein